jgi:hypothetical protein
MTEDEWLACNDPMPMLAFLRSKASDRKVRLFACACFHPVRDFFSKVTQRAVEVAERFADGIGSPDELSQAFRLARGARQNWHDLRRFRLNQSPWDMAEEWADDALRILTDDALRQAGHAFLKRTAQGLKGKRKERRRELQARQTFEDAWWVERKAQADVLHDIVGNPFRPVSPSPQSVLSWNDGIVAKIAQGIYAERAFDRMPILHDALLDAGCADEALLMHCRNPEGHVRGCWALDLILGKE